MQRRSFFKSLAAAVGSSAWLLQKTSQAGQFPAALEALPKDSAAYWGLIKKQFLLPEGYAYFNTGGLGASPYHVLEETQNMMRNLEIYPAPGYDPELWAKTKGLAAQLLGAPSDAVALTNSTTEGNNIIVNGLPLAKGDEIITSTHEHVGLSIPLLNLMQRQGVVIKVFDPDLKRGPGNVERIERLINRRTRLIFVSHITCTVGQLFPEKAIADLAHSKKILFALDGAQVAGNMPIDVLRYNSDFYAAGGHKWVLGPKRTGMLYVKKEHLDTLRPINVGAYSADGGDLKNLTMDLNPTAQRYEYATQNSALYHGLGKAIEFITQIGIERIWQHNRLLAEKLYTGLLQIPGVEALSPAEEEFRTSLITFRIPGKDYRQVANYLINERQLRVRIVSEAQLEGIRVSVHLYNDEEEIDRLLQGIAAAASV